MRLFSLKKLVLAVALVMVMGLVMPMQSRADMQEDLANSGSPVINSELNVQVSGGGSTKCASLPEAQGGVLLGRIIPCMVHSISTATSNFSQKMISALRPLLYTFMLFVMIMFGLRVLHGEPDIYRNALILAIKMGLIITLLDKIPNEYTPAISGVMNQGVQVVTAAVPFPSATCKVVDFSGPQTAPIWALMDCLAGKLFGFTVGASGGTNMVLATSVLGLMTGFFFGGPWAFIVFFGMLGVLFSVFLLILRTALTFISGYLMIAFMLIVSPLFMPLILMEGTARYFEPIWKNIMGAFLAPMLVSAYAMVAMIIFDKALFEPNSLLQQLFKGEAVSVALKNYSKKCDRFVTGDPDKKIQSPFGPLTMDDIGKEEHIYNSVLRTLSAGNDACEPFSVPNMDIGKIGDSGVAPAPFTEAKETFKDMFRTLIKLIIIAWLAAKSQKTFTDSILAQLVGSGAVIRLSKHVVTEGMENPMARAGAAVRGTYGKYMYYAKPDKNSISQAVTGSDFLAVLRNKSSEARKSFTNSLFHR